MSEFEYSNLSCDDSSDGEIVLDGIARKKKTLDPNTLKVSKELKLHYSRLFIDTFSLIDLFVKSKTLTYNSFKKYYESTNFHKIYAKPSRQSEIKSGLVSPHHFITITQDALGVASKFLRSHSREARIGAVYLLYTLYRTQPLKTYLINVKMEPQDYHSTKELVNKYLKEGLMHPANCFYELDIKKRIIITADTINPCLEANYPRAEVQKHLGRVADKYFQIQYEERKDIDLPNKLQHMQHQMCSEMAYINKLSKLTLGYEAVSNYKSKLLEELVEINDTKTSNIVKITNNETTCSKNMHYKNKNTQAFPGKNENVLEDMVLINQTGGNEDQINYQPPEKKKKRKIGQNKNTCENKTAIKIEPDNSTIMPKLSNIIHSDSSCSSIESDDFADEDKYGDMILRFLEEDDIK